MLVAFYVHSKSLVVMAVRRSGDSIRSTDENTH